jgi:hypothetical protein
LQCGEKGNAKKLKFFLIDSMIRRIKRRVGSSRVVVACGFHPWCSKKW